MSVKAKYIKDLPLKNVLDGSESLLVQDLNGTQQAPLGTIVDEIKQDSQEKIGEIKKELAVERERINQLTQLSEGSTTGDAELIDARVGADGIVYENLGEAIRNQIDNNITPYISLPFETIPNYYINYKNGIQSPNTQSPVVYFASDFVKLISNDNINIKNLNYDGSDLAGLAFYNDSKKFISGYQYNDETDLTVIVPEGSVYVRFTLKKHKYFNSVVVYQNQYNAMNVAAQNTKVLSDDLNILMNEADVTVNVSGVYISTNGSVVENGGETYHISNPISVKKCSTLIIKAEGYQSNVAILSKCLGDGEGYKCLVPSENNVYEYTYFVLEDMDVVLCSKMSTQWQLRIISLNSEHLVDTTNKITNIEDKVSSILVPYTVSNTNAYIKYENGKEVLNGTPKTASTDYVYIANMKLFDIKNLNYHTTDLAGLAFYNQNKEFIKGLQYKNDTDLTVNVPNGAVYMRFTLEVEYMDDVYILCNLVDMINKLDDKIQREVINNCEYCQIFHKIAGIGDSLMSGELAYWSEEEQRNRFVDCYNYSWLSNLCKNIGAEAVHYSQGGLTTKSWLAGQLSKMKKEAVLPSAYYIALGTNDSKSIDLGTIEDCGTDVESFYGLYSKIIREVQDFNPHAKIFCCSLYYEVTSNNTEDYCNAIKDMSDKYGCYYIDFFNNYAENYNNSNHLMSLGHFTSPGYVKVGRDIQNLTNEIIKNNLKDFMFVGLNHEEI